MPLKVYTFYMQIALNWIKSKVIVVDSPWAVLLEVVDDNRISINVENISKSFLAPLRNHVNKLSSLLGMELRFSIRKISPYNIDKERIRFNLIHRNLEALEEFVCVQVEDENGRWLHLSRSPEEIRHPTIDNPQPIAFINCVDMEVVKGEKCLQAGEMSKLWWITSYSKARDDGRFLLRVCLQLIPFPAWIWVKNWGFLVGDFNKV